MDLRQARYFEARVEGTEEPFRFHGSVVEMVGKLSMWLHGTRPGDFILRGSTKPIHDAEVVKLAVSDGVLLPPDPIDGDTWDSYYLMLLTFFDGADSMALYLANEAFDQPQNPWLDDPRAARFIHMNASNRLYEKADPSEYAELKLYVESRYPSLYATLALRG